MTLSLRARLLGRLRAFTVLEMLVVVVIIGILAGLAILKFQDPLERAHVAQMKNDLRNFALQNELHRDEFGTYANEANGDVAAAGLFSWLQALANPLSGTSEISRRVPKGFNYSRNVHDVFYRVSADRWYKVLGHEKTGTTCAAQGGNAERWEVLCPAPYLFEPQVSTRNPQVGETVRVSLEDVIAALPTSRACPYTTTGGKCIANFTINSITWYLPDGTVQMGTTQYLEFAIPFAGTFLFRAVISTSQGPMTAVVPVVAGNDPTPAPGSELPVAVFAAPMEPIVAGESAAFSCAPSMEGASGEEITSVTWDFGDGTTATGCDVEHTFPTAGSPNVSMTVTTASGQTRTVSAPTQVREKQERTPEVRVSVSYSPASPAPGDTVTITATSDHANPLTHSWDFGGGVVKGGNPVKHVFSEAGVFPVALTVDDGFGNGGVANFSVTVAHKPPVAIFTFSPDNEPRGTAITFDGSLSSDEVGTVDSYQWTFSDGVTATGVTHTRSFSLPGSYSVMLTVTNDRGASSSMTQTVTVRNQSPTIASYSISPNNVAVGTTINFAASASDPDGDAVQYQWSLGEGTVKIGDSASHVYTVVGKYPVHLTVQDAYGAQTVVVDTVNIINQAPVASFALPSVAVVGETVVFDGSDSYDTDGSVVSYKWAVSNGATGSGVAVSYAFPAAGDYQVTLTVTDDLGKSHDLSRTIRVGSSESVIYSASMSTIASTWFKEYWHAVLTSTYVEFTGHMGFIRHEITTNLGQEHAGRAQVQPTHDFRNYEAIATYGDGRTLRFVVRMRDLDTTRTPGTVNVCFTTNQYGRVYPHIGVSDTCAMAGGTYRGKLEIEWARISWINP